MADIFFGGFNDPSRDSARAFRIALDAMARPGSRHQLDVARGPAPLSPAAATLLLTLTDRTTPLHLAGVFDCEDVRGWIAFHTGAPLTGPAGAAFAIGHWDALPLAGFPCGTPEYPDRGATLIVDHPFGLPTHRLTGPGIKGHVDTSLPGDRSVAFPLGLDLFLTDGIMMAALPRSTKTEVI